MILKIKQIYRPYPVVLQPISAIRRFIDNILCHTDTHDWTLTIIHIKFDTHIYPNYKLIFRKNSTQ